MKPASRRATLMLAALSGLLGSFAFPPVDAGLLAWVAWAPWMAALATAPRLRDAAWSGAVQVIVLHGAQCLWMIHVMRVHGGLGGAAAFGMYAFGAVTVAPYGIAVALSTTVLARRHGALALLAAPFVSALVDVWRSHATLGHPWLIPGMTQSMHPVAMGAADVAGVHGLGAVVLLGNAAVAAAALGLMRREPRQRAALASAIAAAVVAASLLHGALALRRHAAPGAWARALDIDEIAGSTVDWPETGIRVAIVQGAQPQDVKVRSTAEEALALARLQLAMNQAAIDRGAEVIAWSESSHPSTTRRMPWLLQDVQRQLQAAAAARAPETIVGALVEEPVEAGEGAGSASTVTNSALLIRADGLAGRQDKRRLVPFGEYLPWRPVFGWFPQITQLVGTMRPGVSDEALPGRHASYGALICYEVVLAQRVRRVALEDPDVLVNLTNDGWYHGTWMPEQHLRFAILRAVETRRFMLRSANSGISAIVAPDGRIVGRMGEGKRGLLLGSIERRGATTGWLLWGDAPVIVLGLLASGWAVAEAAASRRRRSPAMT